MRKRAGEFEIVLVTGKEPRLLVKDVDDAEITCVTLLCELPGFAYGIRYEALELMMGWSW